MYVLVLKYVTKLRTTHIMKKISRIRRLQIYGEDTVLIYNRRQDDNKIYTPLDYT